MLSPSTPRVLTPADSASETLRRTDLLVLANDHWNFNVRRLPNPGGNHRSILRQIHPLGFAIHQRQGDPAFLRASPSRLPTIA